MTEHIERARILNHQACDDIDHGRLDEAIELYQKALETDPTLAEPHNNLGLAYLLQGEPERAIDAFKTSIELDGGEEPRTNLGLVYSWQGKHDAAIALHKEALDMAPDSVEVQINLGFVYICQNRLDEAKVMLEGALRSDPESAEANTNLGIILCHEDNIEEAIVAHKKAGAMAEARNNLGIVYHQQGKYDAAIAEFKAAIAAEDLQEAHTNLSIVTGSVENIDTSELQTSPIGVPVGVPAVWCEFVN